MNISFIAASSLGKDSLVFKFHCTVKFSDSNALAVYMALRISGENFMYDTPRSGDPAMILRLQDISRPIFRRTVAGRPHRVRAGGEADFHEGHRHGHVVPVRCLSHRVADHARGAQMNLGLVENRVDCLGKI